MVPVKYCVSPTCHGRSRADLAADSKAVAVGQPKVERNEIERASSHALHRLRARAGLADAKALALEAAAQQKPNLGIVLDDQNMRRRRLEHNDSTLRVGLLERARARSARHFLT
jgi:hypothetical protein